jgi:Fe-S oxidoreductase
MSNEAAIDRCRISLDFPVRPTFCNVPYWAEQALYITSVLAIALFAWGIWRHWRLWHAGQPDAPARNSGGFRQRLGHIGRYVLGQRKTVERRYPGIFHSGIFYGFGLLFIGTVLATIDWDITRLIGNRLLGEGGPLAGGIFAGFSYLFQGPLAGRLLTGQFYLWYELVLDAAGLVFTLGLLAAIWRRHIQEPHHVKGAWDFMLWSLLFINISGFLIEGLRLFITEPTLPWRGWSWVGYGIASLLWSIPTSDAAGLRLMAADAHIWLWLAHSLGSLLFIAAIPYTNAVHMITLSANAWFKSTEAILPGAALQKIDLENSEVWGVGKMADLNWKQRLGADSCVRCGRCETVCPAYMSGTPLNPKEIIVTLSEQLRIQSDGPFAIDAGGEIIVGAGLLIDPAALFACTTCGACVEVCPAFIEIVDDIVDMRRYLTLNEGALPGTSATTLKNMGTAGNPWGYAQSDRLGWAEGLEVPVAEEGQHYEVIYWVGCSASYDPRNQKIARAMVKLMKQAGVRFAVMQEESCTCESARRLGEEYLFQTATEANVASFQRYDFDRVVCHCPHCFNTIANEYAQFGGNFVAIHHSQLIAELVAEGRLSAEGIDEKVVYHDSCYLGRYNNEYDAPREVLRASGANLVEPERSREKGLCCGGGGGKMWFEGEAEREVNLIRMEELLATEPDTISVACPFCMTMLDDAAKNLGAEGVKVLDISEVMAAALGED